MINQFSLPLLVVPIGGILSAGGTWLIRRWSIAHGFVDRPGGHKGHRAPVALGGGVAVTLAVVMPIVVGVWAASELSAPPSPSLPEALTKHLEGIIAKTPAALAISAAACILCIVGLLDDRRPLPAGLRLIIQIVVAGVLVVGFDLRMLSHLPYAASAGLSILWILTLTNSFNFLDNMDGLACGVAAIAAAVFAVAAMLAGQIFVPTLCWLLVGALLGFLPFNFHPARIYVGDAGSTVIGMLLAVFTILTSYVDPNLGPQPFGVVTPLIVMAVPLYDTASVFFLRWRSGVPISTADRRHFSHRLLRRGMSVPRAVLVIWLATLATALPALMLPRIESWLHATIILGQTILVVGLVALLEGSGGNDGP